MTQWSLPEIQQLADRVAVQVGITVPLDFSTRDAGYLHIGIPGVVTLTQWAEFMYELAQYVDVRTYDGGTKLHGKVHKLGVLRVIAENYPVEEAA